MRKVCFFLFANLLLASTVRAQQDQCADILKAGIFDTARYQADAAYRQRLDSAFCKADFRSFSEAQSYGFGLAFPVYGIPGRCPARC